MPKAATSSAFYFQTRSPLDHHLILFLQNCVCVIFSVHVFSPCVTTAAVCLPWKKSHMVKAKSVKDMHYVLFVKETKNS